MDLHTIMFWFSPKMLNIPSLTNSLYLQSRLKISKIQIMILVALGFQPIFRRKDGDQIKCIFYEHRVEQNMNLHQEDVG